MQDFYRQSFFCRSNPLTRISRQTSDAGASGLAWSRSRDPYATVRRVAASGGQCSGVSRSGSTSTILRKLPEARSSDLPWEFRECKFRARKGRSDKAGRIGTVVFDPEAQTRREVEPELETPQHLTPQASAYPFAANGLSELKTGEPRAHASATPSHIRVNDLERHGRCQRSKSSFPELSSFAM